MTGQGAWVVAAAVAAAVAVLVHDRPRTGPGRPGLDQRFGPLLARGWRALTGRHPRPPVGSLLAALVAELRAGQPTRRALELACADLSPPPCPQARRAAALGGDVPAALRRDAEAPGCGVLRGLAACWEVAEYSGAGLADAVDRLAQGHRSSQRANEQLTAEVAAARASARILALLPMFGLLIGQWIGARPLEWFAGTWPGRLALLVGVLLQVAGLLWLRRMTAAVRAQLEP